jgi:hypothetical protein
MSETSPIDPTEPRAQRSYAPLRVLALLMALAGIAGLVLAYLSPSVPRETFFRAYLVGVILWLGASLGCLFYQMAHHLTWGEWGKIVRRPMESAIACIPLMAVLFIPLLLNMKYLFPWANPEMVHNDHVLEHKAPYLNPSMVTLRWAIFFGIWTLLAIILYGQGRKIRAAGEKGTTKLAYRISAIGILLHFYTVTFLIIDWVMSRDAHWFSSIIGFIHLSAQGMMGMSIAVMAVCWRFGRKDDQMPVEKMTLNDLGTILLANTIFWTYTSVAQLIITYSGNMVNEQTWYIARGFGRNLENNWLWVATYLIVFGFGLNVFLLLMRGLKQRMRYLIILAFLVMLNCGVEAVWWIVPSGVKVTESFIPNSFHWVDAAAIIGVGGVWLSAFFFFLSGRPVLSPATEPKPGHGHGHGSVHALGHLSGARVVSHG